MAVFLCVFAKLFLCGIIIKNSTTKKLKKPTSSVSFESQLGWFVVLFMVNLVTHWFSRQLYFVCVCSHLSTCVLACMLDCFWMEDTLIGSFSLLLGEKMCDWAAFVQRWLTEQDWWITLASLIHLVGWMAFVHSLCRAVFYLLLLYELG